MFAVGLLYLLFEKSILAQSQASKGKLEPPVADTLSRAILGIQVILLNRLLTTLLTLLDWLDSLGHVGYKIKYHFSPGQRGPTTRHTASRVACTQ